MLSNFCNLGSANQVNFIEECMMHTEKHVFVKKRYLQMS